jgi:hypothetical protein
MICLDPNINSVINISQIRGSPHYERAHATLGKEAKDGKKFHEMHNLFAKFKLGQEEMMSDMASILSGSRAASRNVRRNILITLVFN